MKKIFIILYVVLTLCSCGKKEEEQKIKYTYEIVSSKVDMSGYEGVNSVKHNFRLITPSELYKVIDNKSSGVFLIGSTKCGCCQRVCRYLNEVAQELDVTVYYIDAYNEEEPLMDSQSQEKFKEYLDPILGEDDGKKAILTPQVFSVINGEFGGSQICFDNYVLDLTPTEEQIEKFKDSYRAILKPFSKVD